MRWPWRRPVQPVSVPVVDPVTVWPVEETVARPSMTYYQPRRLDACLLAVEAADQPGRCAYCGARLNTGGHP